MSRTGYDHSIIEPKWQQAWQERGVFSAPDKPGAEKRIVLDMFPYPSGDGLHVGHPEGYTATDIVSRYLRMKGVTVLHPMGWDAFGLPAENAAIKKGIHPRIVTEQNVANFKRQIQSLGFSYDWNREVNTTDPAYYRWTQWIFLQLYKAGLAYEKEAPIWWCPKDKTGLANEEVVDGKCDRCGTAVERKMLKQWMLKITAYADRLLEGLDRVDWPEGIKTLQRNWIGRSEGAEVDFAVGDHTVTVFTTRPDTLFGATYLVLSPEHPLVPDITTPEQRAEVEQYQKNVASKSDLERTSLEKEKTGVFTGAYAINPVNNEKIPVWIADYVLASYGTGAIMAVPAHDERDFAFAKKFELAIVEVIAAGHEHDGCWTGEGLLQNSDTFDRMPSELARIQIVKHLEAQSKAATRVNYKLRDWVFSRQRYWGEPIPLVHCDKDGVVPVPEDQLPLLLPDVEKYEPTGTGESPLAAIDEWVNTTCPACGGPAKRETNTMPQWAGSCWYYLRYIDPKNTERFADPEKMQAWLPVDLYVGGAEHAVLHLLYARFWHKVLFDGGHIPKDCGDEPFMKLKNQGLILGEDGEKMSKSRGNVVNPDDIVEKFGADAFRMYEMFMGPFEDAKPWNTNGLVGVRRFLDRVWLAAEKAADVPSDDAARAHRYVAAITNGIDTFGFNTCVSDLMKWSNEWKEQGTLSAQEFSTFLQCLAPFAPHIAEELWQKLGHTDLLATASWPTYDPAQLQQQAVSIVIQVNGKHRGSVTVQAGSNESVVRQAAEADPNVKKYLTNEPKKVIFVADRLMNFVIIE